MITSQNLLINYFVTGNISSFEYLSQTEGLTEVRANAEKLKEDINS